MTVASVEFYDAQHRSHGGRRRDGRLTVAGVTLEVSGVVVTDDERWSVAGRIQMVPTACDPVFGPRITFFVAGPRYLLPCKPSRLTSAN